MHLAALQSWAEEAEDEREQACRRRGWFQGSPRPGTQAGKTRRNSWPQDPDGNRDREGKG